MAGQGEELRGVNGATGGPGQFDAPVASGGGGSGAPAKGLHSGPSGAGSGRLPL